MSDCWDGPDKVDLNKGNYQHKIPNEMTITIGLPHADSMKEAQLDINETTLVFSYPNIYYLDLNLKYRCDTKGNAKFDKSKKTLTIRLPIIGLTEESKKVLD